MGNDLAPILNMALARFPFCITEPCIVIPLMFGFYLLKYSAMIDGEWIIEE